MNAAPVPSYDQGFALQQAVGNITVGGGAPTREKLDQLDTALKPFAGRRISGWIPKMAAGVKDAVAFSEAVRSGATWPEPRSGIVAALQQICDAIFARRNGDLHRAQDVADSERDAMRRCTMPYANAVGAFLLPCRASEKTGRRFMDRIRDKFPGISHKFGNTHRYDPAAITAIAVALRKAGREDGTVPTQEQIAAAKLAIRQEWKPGR